MKKTMKKIINNIEELDEFAKKLIQNWHKKFLLEWDLWVGKTEFTKHLAKNIWIMNVKSPTYTYINIYDELLLHWDFYRIETREDFLSMWILEQILEYEYVCIERPKFKDLYLDEEFIQINITHRTNSSRVLEYS